MRLSTLTIERFKRIERVDFNLSGMNILIGGNNSGKSTIVQAVHFAFTLLQSLTIAEKWPVQAKKSSTISPTELIYIPSEDLLVAGFSFYVTERVDQGSKMDGTRHYGSDLQNSLRKRSQFFG